MRTIVVQDAARHDLENLADYLAERSLNLSLRFARAANQAFRQLAGMPGLGAPVEFRNPAFADVRCFRVPGFGQHVIFYRPIDDGIEVLRVLHGARDIPRLFEDESEPREDA